MSKPPPPTPARTRNATPHRARQPRGGASIYILALLVIGLAVGAVVLLGGGPSNAPAPDPEADRERVTEWSNKLSLAIQNDRPTDVFLGPAERLATELDGFAPAHTLYGQVLMHNGRLEESADQFQRVLDADPQNQRVHAFLGSVRVKLEDLPAARSHFEQAISLNKRDTETRVKLADVLVKQGELDAALAAALDAIQLDAAQHKAYVILSVVYERKSEPRLAAQQMDKALAVLPDDERETKLAYVKRQAAMLRRANDPEAALAVLLDLPRTERYSLEMAEDIARTYGMRSLPGLAGLHCQTVSELHPGADAPAAQAAAWYLKAGDGDAARAMTERLRAINPRHPDLLELESEVSAMAGADPS